MMAKPVLFLVVDGQSNVVEHPAFDWQPPANLFVWDWDGIAGHVGNSFVAPSGLQITLGLAAGGRLATIFPEQTICLCSVGIDGLPISKWLGGTGPDAYAARLANQQAAMVAAGVGRPAANIWWQGESDTPNSNTRNAYASNFETLDGKLIGDHLLASDTPTIICGISPYVFGWPAYSAGEPAMNAILEGIAAAYSSKRTYLPPGALSADPYWEKDVSSYIHMAAIGYKTFGDTVGDAIARILAARAAPSRYAVVVGSIVDNVVVWDGVSPWEPPSGAPILGNDLATAYPNVTDPKDLT
jgi:hypothetical protein